MALTGKDNAQCTESLPCRTFAAAVRALGHEPGEVLVASGTYPAQFVRADIGPTGEGRTLVRPASGSVTVAGVDLEAPGVEVTGMTSTGAIKVGHTGDGSGFSWMTVRQGGAYLSGATDAFLVDSSVEPAPDRDAVQVKAESGSNPNGLRIESNVLGPTERGPERGHVDCVQILAGERLSVRDNTMVRCASQGLIVGSGAGGTVGPDNVYTGNVIQLCGERTSDCGGHSAVQLSHGERAVFAQNTVLGGGAIFDAPGIRVVGNVIHRFSRCASADVRFNVYTSSGCKDLDSNNVQADRLVVDPDSEPPDATLVDGSPGRDLVPADVAVTSTPAASAEQPTFDAGAPAR